MAFWLAVVTGEERLKNQSDKVSVDIQRTVKDPEDIDVSVVFYQISNAVVLVKDDANLARLFTFVSMSESRMVS